MQNQEVRGSINFNFEFAVKGPAKKIQNKSNFYFCRKGKNM